MSYLLCCEKRFQILNAKLSWTAHSAVFVVSTKHKNNNNQHPNNQLQRACKRLEFFTDVKAFSPVLSVSLSINKNWKIHMLWVSDVKSLPMKGTKYFPLSHVLYVLTSNPGRTLGAVITPLRFIRNRPSSFVHTMCCIDFFCFFEILKLLHSFAAVMSPFQIRVILIRSNCTVKLFFFFFISQIQKTNLIG